MIQLIDGKKSLNDLQKDLPFGKFRLTASVVNLWKEGFIRPVKSGSATGKMPVARLKEKYFLHFWILAATLAILAGYLYIGRMVAGIPVSDLCPVDEIQNAQKRKNIHIAIMNYTLNAGQLPENLDTLTDRHYLSRRDIHNSRRERFRYQVMDSLEYKLE